MRFSHIVTTFGVLCLAVALPGCGGRPAPAASADASVVEERRSFALAPGSSESAPEPAGFTFAADGIGAHLAERLRPGRSLTLEPPAPAAGPRPWRSARLGNEPAAGALPPAANGPATPRVLPAERLRSAKLRGAADNPPLALEQLPTLPARMSLPHGPLARVDSAEPARPPTAGLTARPPERPSISDDPTLEWSRQSAFTPVEMHRTQHAPFLRLSIPDPFAPQRVSPLRAPPPDNDAPALSTARPGIPVLPAK